MPEGNRQRFGHVGRQFRKKHNTVVLDLDHGKASRENTELRSRQPKMKIKTLEEGKKYEYGGIVVQGKKGKLHFSSPKHGTRGEVHDRGWKIEDAN